VPDATDTGDANVSVCHPEAVSVENVPDARTEPLSDHRVPT
jgi:hypothetical protein